MPNKPTLPRAIAFFDGQNLYHAAKAAFGYTYPNYNIVKLAQALCEEHVWHLEQVRFYTGLPAQQDDRFWNGFWRNKLAVMGRQDVFVFTRPLRYRNHSIRQQDGQEQTVLVGEEKGIDVRIALDIIRLAHHRQFDVALVFSQDQDLSEAADELRLIAQEQKRWIKMASAFPVSPTSRRQRGIAMTDWMPIDRELYDRCRDRANHRPKLELTA